MVLILNNIAFYNKNFHILPSVLPADLHCAPHISSCGHIMHASCWKNYFEDTQNNERQRSRMRVPQSYDTEKSEFLCPLCRCLSNSVVPLIPQFHLLQPPLLFETPEEVDDTKAPIYIDFSEWINAMLIAVKYKKTISHNDQAPKGTVKATQSGGEQSADAGSTSSSNSSPSKSPTSAIDLVRYYTCPLDQVKQEMQDQTDTANIRSSAGANFARIYTDREGQEIVFSPSVFEMMDLFSQSVYKVGFDAEPELHDERIPIVSMTNIRINTLGSRQ